MLWILGFAGYNKYSEVCIIIFCIKSCSVTLCNTTMEFHPLAQVAHPEFIVQPSLRFPERFSPLFYYIVKSKVMFQLIFLGEAWFQHILGILAPWFSINHHSIHGQEHKNSIIHAIRVIWINFYNKSQILYAILESQWIDETLQF